MQRTYQNQASKEKLLLTLSEEGLIDTQRLLGAASEANFLDEQLDDFVNSIFQWRPILTAPMDGTPVIAATDGVAYVAWFTKTGDWAFFESPTEGKLAFFPTHWMPLPKLPITSDTQSKAQ